MKRTRYFLICLWIFLAALHASDLSAQVRSGAEKIRLVFSAIGSSQSPLWIGYEAGIFRKHGLDAELLYVAGGSRAAQVVLSGEVPIAMFNGGSVISADLAGGDLVNVASGMNVMPFFLVAGPSIRQIEDLKGKKVAVTRFASATDYALRYAAEKWPVKPDRDFTVLQLGGQPEMIAAIKSGAIQAAMLNAEFYDPRAPGRLSRSRRGERFRDSVPHLGTRHQPRFYAQPPRHGAARGARLVRHHSLR